ncbi:MAG: nitronate monooxygenase [Alphaproteobacteria bacterium TMED87]|nr:MAG: nitronate monooxygenase [Alphaproteobacteria bacterium TMED87]
MNINDKIKSINKRISIPVFVAPMYLVTSPQLVVSACKSGVVGVLPTSNAKTLTELENWFETITSALQVYYKQKPMHSPPWAVNIVVHSSSKRFEDDLNLIKNYKPEIVITALGSPARVTRQVHDYGGMVFADVSSVEYAKKALQAGADGLVLISSGAGGHTGSLTAFSFVPAVRSFFKGPIVLGGGIVNGAGIRAVQILGANFAYMGTKFIATKESLASHEYKTMIINSTEADIITSDYFTGVAANYLTKSIIKEGIDPKSMDVSENKKFDSTVKSKAWFDIWSAGQGVRTINEIQTVKNVIRQLKEEYEIS